MIRRILSVMGVGGALWACGVTAWALDLRSGVPEGNIEVYLNQLVATPLDPANEFAFIDLVPFDDGTGRLAVSTIQGGVRVIDGSGQLDPTSLLTKAQTQLVLPQESGMTGIVFHPDFNNPGTFGYGKLYTISTEAPVAEGGLSDANVDFPFDSEEHQDVVLEWDLATFGNVPGNAANNQFTGTYANSREILRVDEPGPFHNVFDLAFNTSVGPGDDDYGMLYITSGDGGNSSVQSNQARAEGAQDLSTIYGNILRIDPDPTGQTLVRTSANTGLPAYSIPSDNPYNGDDVTESKTSATLAEIWANGVRSPWRLTFDRANGDLYLGEVGENLWEEADLIEKGKNYGWGLLEGTHDGTLIPGDGTIDTTGLTPPIFELSHSDASHSISGGFVYRGSAIPELYGKYVFADLGQGFNSSAIFYAIVDPDDPDGNVGDVFEFQLSDASPKFENGTQELPERIFSIGEDENGELYLVAGPDPRQTFDPNRPSLVIRFEPSLPFLFGDLDGDLAMTSVDWTQFKSGQGMDFMGLTAEQTYPFGDLDGDLDHDLDDFWLFRTAYENFNGMGSFVELLRVPEPGAYVLLFVGGTLGALTVRHRRGDNSLQARSSRARGRCGAHTVAVTGGVGLIACLSCAGMARAQITNIPIPNGDFEDWTSIASWGSLGGTLPGQLAVTTDEFYNSGGPAGEFGLGWTELTGHQSGTKMGLQHPRGTDHLRTPGLFAHGEDNALGGPFFSGHFDGFVNLTSSDSGGASGTNELATLQSQILGQLQEGTFIATLDVGFRAGANWNDQYYELALVAGGVATDGVYGSTGGSVLGASATRVLTKSVGAAGVGNNQTQLVYSLTIPAESGMIGQDYALRIHVANNGTQDGAPSTLNTFTQANFDNAQLTFEGEFHPPYLSLRVDPTGGRMQIENNTIGDLSINSYRITSLGESLVPSDWSPISNQSLPGFPVGTGDNGDGWEAAPSPNAGELVEWYLQGDSTLPIGDVIRLGKAFSTAVDAEQDLLFQYRLSNGNKITGEVIYAPIAGVAGDYNDNGVVDAADYTIWRNHLGQVYPLTNEDPDNQDGQVTSADYDFWKVHFGETETGYGAAAAAVTASAVPEPSTKLMLALASCMLITGWLRQRRPFEPSVAVLDRTCSTVHRCNLRAV